MIKYINHTDIDKGKWDNAISEAKNGTICAYSWYLDIVSPGWDALITDDYSEIFPVTKAKKYGIEYLRQPLFTQQLGLITCRSSSEPDCSEQLEILRKKFKLIEINLRYNNVFFHDKYIRTDRPNSELNISLRYEHIYDGYSENIKRNIKKAIKAELSVSNKGDLHDVIALFRNNRGKTIQGFSESSYILLRRIVDQAIQKGCGEIYITIDKNSMPCAGAVILKGHGICLFLFSGLNSRGKSLGAMPFLIDKIIQNNCEKFEKFDFEGSRDMNLARFYNSFGSHESVYLHIRYNKLPYPFRWFK